MFGVTEHRPVLAEQVFNPEEGGMMRTDLAPDLDAELKLALAFHPDPDWVDIQAGILQLVSPQYRFVLVVVLRIHAAERLELHLADRTVVVQGGADVGGERRIECSGHDGEHGHEGHVRVFVQHIRCCLGNVGPDRGIGRKERLDGAASAGCRRLPSPRRLPPDRAAGVPPGMTGASHDPTGCNAVRGTMQEWEGLVLRLFWLP